MYDQLFHIYKKRNNRPVKVCLTVDEMESMIANREVDWENWEVLPCYTEKDYQDASY